MVILDIPHPASREDFQSRISRPNFYLLSNPETQPAKTSVSPRSSPLAAQSQAFSARSFLDSTMSCDVTKRYTLRTFCRPLSPRLRADNRSDRIRWDVSRGGTKRPQRRRAWRNGCFRRLPETRPSNYSNKANLASQKTYCEPSYWQFSVFYIVLFKQLAKTGKASLFSEISFSLYFFIGPMENMH